MQLIVKKDPTELAQAVADWLVTYINDVLQRQQRFTIALSGGSTPEALFKLLAESPYREVIPWDKLHIFWGDERYVPLDDDRSNARMAYQTLLNHVPVESTQVFVWQTNQDPDVAADRYANILHTYFDGYSRTFDLVMLGMGDDGHTLSLFPGTEVVHEEQDWTKAYFLESQNMYRLTLTAPVVNKAAAVAFLVAGPKKAAPLNEVLHGDYRPDMYPSQVIRPTDGELYWFVDEAAAAQVQPS
ncbi:6-phosphogluconolactonase [Fibrisoma limi]|nr:6-phosphogluconolactonase [Fibrisoma limi]